jgi:multiple sugar transport system substrate-binding protein
MLQKQSPMAVSPPRCVHSLWRVVAVGLLFAACGDRDGGLPTLTWYVNPDNGGQGRLAEKCTREANGAYRIDVQVLPTAADAQREQLVRRLAGRDRSIDLMSLDPPFVAEFANAGFLHEITHAEDVAFFTEGVLEAPRQAAYWNGALVAAPLWANTQLLWFRKSVAAAAGVDPTREGFTWQEAIAAAERQDKFVAVPGDRYEGYVVWINALLTSSGGRILADPAAGADATPAIASTAGDRAAEIIGGLARSPAAPPDVATAREEEVRAAFQGERGGFMVNWPYVWSAARDAVRAGALAQAVVDDIGWARYPRTERGTPSRPPLGGIDLAIGAFTEHPEQALRAARCITSLESQIELMLDTGVPAARAAAYDHPAVRERLPMAALIRDSIAAAGPRPLTPYWVDVSAALQRTWHPPASVRAPETPRTSARVIADVLQGRVLL